MGDANHGPTVTDRDILTVFATMEGEQFQLETIADELPISDEALVDRLADLEERGLLVADEEAPGAVWQLTDGAADEAAGPDGRVETAVEAQATKTTGVETVTRAEETPDTPPPDPQSDSLEPIRDSPVDELEAFEPPGTPAEQATRRRALLKVYMYLHDRGQASREAIESDVFPVASAGYEQPDEWWEQVIQPGLERLPDLAGTEGGSQWRFAADSDAMDE